MKGKAHGLPWLMGETHNDLLSERARVTVGRETHEGSENITGNPTNPRKPKKTQENLQKPMEKPKKAKK